MAPLKREGPVCVRCPEQASLYRQKQIIGCLGLWGNRDSLLVGFSWGTKCSKIDCRAEGYTALNICKPTDVVILNG